MTRLIRTEWLKLATTRGPWAVITGVIALTALITPFAMADIGYGDASRAADAREALAIGPGFLSALMLLLIGALAAAGEFHHRSIVTTYLITPRRGRVLAAKLVAHATLGAVVAAIGVAISFPIVLLMARGEHLTVASDGHLVALAAAMVAVGALSSLVGVAIGSILRHQTAAIVVILVWTLLVEKLFGGFFPPVLPFGAIMAAVGLAGDDGPSILASLALLAFWASLFGFGATRSSKLDVT
jgi:ABC-2 type transport system permease protein